MGFIERHSSSVVLSELCSLKARALAVAQHDLYTLSAVDSVFGGDS